MTINVLKQVDLVPLENISLYPENPREMEASQFEKLKKSITEYGFIDPLIVNKRTHESFTQDEKKPTVIGGNMRYRAAKELGIKEVPVSWVDLDKAKEKILNIALNRIAGKWDVGKLEKMIYDLSNEDLGLDLDLTGLEDWELKLYNPAEDVDAEDIEKIVGTDEKPTFVLKVVFSDEKDFEKASRILGGDKRIRNIIRGDNLLKILEKHETEAEQN